ncbi:MAG TPA: hypothetical protein VGG57_16585 [Stellaceae bacterium]
MVLALASCQPLPHPFADDRPPASLLTVRDSAGVTISPIAGAPGATAEKLRAAVAKELQKHDIPASATTASVASYQLDGRIEEAPPAAGKARVTVFWRLRNAAGKMVGERQPYFEAAPADWNTGADGSVGELAAASADTLAPLLSDEPLPHPLTTVATAAEGRLRLVVGGIKGAPGDGDTSLGGSITAVLKRHDLDIISDRKAGDALTLDAEVAMSPSPGDPGKQHIKIVWRLRRADGSQVGTVGQENDVPKGTLDGAWGDVAYTVAVAAESGILELIARSGPPPKPAPKPAADPANKPAPNP